MLMVTVVAQYARWSQGSRYPGQRKGEDHEQQQHAADPCHLTRLLVRPGDDDAQHVDNGSNDDEAGAEHVQAAHDPSERDLLHDIAHAVIGRRRRRHVVEAQDDPAGELDAEQEQDDAAGGEPPAGSLGNRLVEDVRPNRAPASTGVDPVGQAAECPLHSRTRTWPPSMRVAIVASGAGGGTRFDRARPVVDSAVARAAELLTFAIPAHAAAKMRAGRVERGHVRCAGADEEHGPLVDHLGVSVAAGDSNHDRGGYAWWQVTEGGCRQPGLVFPAERRRYRGAAQYDAQRTGDGGMDRCHNPREETPTPALILHDAHEPPLPNACIPVMRHAEQSGLRIVPRTR
jgi:hypothetical protein